MARLKKTNYTSAYKFVCKVWTQAKYIALICTTLFLTSQGVNYAHDVVPVDHNHIPKFVNEDGKPIIVTEVYISENTSNYLIGTIKAVDEDEDDTLTYSLLSEDEGFNYYELTPGHKQSYRDFYTINSETGEVRIGSVKLDYEAFPLTFHATHIYQPVRVKVEDGNGGSASFAYHVLIADENDNAPVFSADSQTLSINENEPSNTTVGTVSASDADLFAGDHTYSIETENVPFTIESSKRSGTIKTTSLLDYETANSYTLTVKVDDGFGTDTISVTINVTNDASDDPTTQQNTDTQVPQTGRDDDLQQPNPGADPEPEPNYTIIPFDYEKEGVGKVVFSELMLAHLGKYPQWIELYNTTDQDIDINGWKIVGRYLDDAKTINILESQVISKSFTIKGKETGLIVSFATPNSRDRISEGLADKAYVLQSTLENLWNYEGLVLELQDAEDNPIDRFGNLNEENEIAWEIPKVVRDKRISLIRRLKSIRSQEYNFTFGTTKFGWFPAEKAERQSENRNQYFYGRQTDIGEPGYRTENREALPVTLSSFKAQRNNNAQVILSWVTESELDNAGFNILRSQSKQGPFVKVNPKLIQGAGTTGKRSSYTWTDTTAKSHIVYYYRIEDVSFAGFRNQLTTVRTRGHVSASERYITQWGNLKKRN